MHFVYKNNIRAGIFHIGRLPKSCLHSVRSIRYTNFCSIISIMGNYWNTHCFKNLPKNSGRGPWNWQTPANSTKLHKVNIRKKQLSLHFLESFITTAEAKWSLFLPSTELEQSASSEDWTPSACMCWRAGHKRHRAQDSAMMGESSG